MPLSLPSSRRSFLKRASLTAASAVLPGSLLAQDRARGLRTISILHTTDLHGHIRPTRRYDGIGNLGGLARCATQIRRWRRENPNSLVLDIGDVYQGTAVGWMTRGRLMIDLFNQLNYDAWVLGNHEFDWGPEVVVDAVTRSKMPILAGNMKLAGKPAGTLEEPAHPLARILPHTVKELGGIRIGLVGLITPGLPFWLRPELLDGFEVLDPLEPLQASLKFLRGEAKVDAVVVCGHMGLKPEDDFANRVAALLEGEDGPEVYLGGHTHRDQPSRVFGQTLYSQANYFGIHCGRVDLSFDLASRKLVERRAFTMLMDERVPEDPLVLEVASKNLQEADSYLENEIGSLEMNLSAKQPGPAEGSPVQALISAALRHAAAKEGLEPDGVFHGTFGSGDLPAGPKTVADAWRILPYDNKLLVLYLTRTELIGVLNESFQNQSDRALFGFECSVAQSGENRRGDPPTYFVRSLKSLRRPEVDSPDHRYCIVCNAYDAQSGGKRLMRLRALAGHPDARGRVLKPSSRQALIDFFADKEVVKAADLQAVAIPVEESSDVPPPSEPKPEPTAPAPPP